MDKRWYPVAFSLSMVGCGGDVDDGTPSATGGLPQYYYGVMITGGSTGTVTTFRASGGQPLYGMLMTTGGRTHVDTGVPAATGGMTPMPPYGVIPVGGAPVASGGTGSETSGGRSSIDAGTPAQLGGQVATDYGVLPSTGGRTNSTTTKKPGGTGGLPVVYGVACP